MSREISADIPIPHGDVIKDEALSSWPGFPVTGPDRETRIGEIVDARSASGGIQVTIRLDDGVQLDDQGAVVEASNQEASQALPGWFFVHPRPAIDDTPGPFAAAVNPWQRDASCAQCSEPGTRLVRARPDLPVYDPAAYELLCPRHG